ncbi:helix-turn-helix domain-containing protein [Candidatus Parcubacteria bacterium]|nr:MAG: helix-turn-helix domain-containing protein [Candidatus Parcubacteria bacterium]
MSSILTTIGRNLRALRKQLGLSQERLAELAELHRTYIIIKAKSIFNDREK